MMDTVGKSQSRQRETLQVKHKSTVVFCFIGHIDVTVGRDEATGALKLNENSVIYIRNMCFPEDEIEM